MQLSLPADAPSADTDHRLEVMGATAIPPCIAHADVALRRTICLLQHVVSFRQIVTARRTMSGV